MLFLDRHSYFTRYSYLQKKYTAQVGSLLKLQELNCAISCIALCERKVATLLEAAEGQRFACHKAYGVSQSCSPGRF